MMNRFGLTRSMRPEGSDCNNEEIYRQTRRLAIYFFFDKDGVVDDYVPYYLAKLRLFCNELCVVVNGKLNDDGREKLEANCDRLLIRANIGFDSWAYKEAMESYGYAYVADNYDELLLNNFTHFGPVYPFSEMFDTMDKCKCDFWGHSRHPALEFCLCGKKITQHIQSYFLVVRKRILQSKYFIQYWGSLKLPLNYYEAIAYHEVRFTSYFESLGFISEAYMPWKVYRSYIQNAAVHFAYSQVVLYRSPLLKRKVFYVDGNRFQFPSSESHSVFDLVKFIKHETDYNLNYILQNIERTQDIRLAPEPRKILLWKYLCGKIGFWLTKTKKMRLWERVNSSFSTNEFLRLFDRAQ